MKWGLVARAEDRGLGIIAWETHRHLNPDRTLVVEMGDLARGFSPHLDRFPDATVLPFRDGVLPEGPCREWLAGLDVVLILETAYDWRFIDWARDARCRTVLLAMPEFYRADVPQPDAIWNPTTWRHDRLPDGARVVPVPVATDRFQTPPRRTQGPVRVLHNAGHRAAMDRNGTQSFTAALRLLRVGLPIEVVISGQDGRLPSSRTPQNVGLTTQPRGQVNYWDVPVGFDLLVMPRRYGGLCLPVQEAMAAGVIPMMPDVSPNWDWPIVPLLARPHGEMATPGGILPLVTVDGRVLTAEIARICADPDELALRRQAVLAWADAHSWDQFGPVWMAELQAVADGLASPGLPR